MMNKTDLITYVLKTYVRATVLFFVSACKLQYVFTSTR
jgi:hypothetical protein